MIKRHHSFYKPLSEEEKENHELLDWIWNSHYWIESYPGYAQCRWCEKYHTSEMGISIDYPLCGKNPAIEKLLKTFGESLILTVY